MKLLVNVCFIATLSIGGIFKPSVQSEILQNSQEVEFLKPSVQAEILQNYQEVELIKPSVQAEILRKSQDVGFINHQYSQKYCKIIKR